MSARDEWSPLDEPCSWCVAELTSPAGQLRIIFPSNERLEGAEPDEIPRLYSVMTNGYLHERVALMRRAIAFGWPIEVNGSRSGLPVTTWHGDPICEVHLYHAWQAEREPRTVRMAQWRGAR